MLVSFPHCLIQNRNLAARPDFLSARSASIEQVHQRDKMEMPIDSRVAPIEVCENRADAANRQLLNHRLFLPSQQSGVAQRARDSQRFNSVRLRMLMPAKITTPKTVEQITAANSLSIFMRSLDCRIK